MNLNTERIRALNDELRRNLLYGHAVMTTGIAALGPEAVARIVKTIAVFDDFCHANDPYQEHDFGSFEVDGQMIFFKIDYFDKTKPGVSRCSKIRSIQSPRRRGQAASAARLFQALWRSSYSQLARISSAPVPAVQLDLCPLGYGRCMRRRGDTD